ncbi:hypothetical protein [Dinghuibacter silviterrae]|uniref:Uncharacterized protein n=1 Tax=Dinghuibacter silviterrae TaxID=1539049 RepID=A0A4R8DUX7_9BACT|nr:hypothetical protein [Dinghuibacter silviterrae]TDX01217.1 hypothetical protein EDB95_2249 [Dinghuibacter silviterrae]
MKTLYIDSFEMLSSEELIAVHGGGGLLSSLNPLISGLTTDLEVDLAAVSKTVTDLTTNLDAATGGLGLGSLGLGSLGTGNLLGGGLLGGSGNGLLGGGLNL